ncbi:MAG: PRC-barrel domain-containing protein [Phycisphaerales bacterium]|nr:PRC-barrel domain-containing protein [Phycisphaerales bacterium]MCB9863144.1 PRC-barrel domain-containing protein [Phycisphaerales bacterium]
MNTVIRTIAGGAVAVALFATVARAGIPSRSEAMQASQQLKQGKRSLADIVKKAEQHTGGAAIAVSLCRSPDAAERAGNDAERGKDATEVNGNASTQNDPRSIEYRVTCLVDNTKLKDVYVCAESADVKAVRNANEHSRSTRQHRGSPRGNSMIDASGRSVYGGATVSNRDRYDGADDRFSAGPDGHYERIVVWHFVPNDGSDRDAEGNDESHVRTKYDPNAANHHAANLESNAADRDQATQTGSSVKRNQPGSMILGSKLLDASATNSQGQDLGDVDEIVINPQDGKVVYTAIAYGGVLGIGEKRFAIPCSSVNRVNQDKVFLDVQKAELENNPGFKNSAWPTQSDAMLSHGNSDKVATVSQVRKLSEVFGRPLKNEQNEPLGTIDDAVVDASAGQVAYLIVDCADRDGLVAVPCAAIQMKDDACVVRMTKDRFNQIPSFNENNFPSWTSMTWNDQAHTQFNVQPYWKSHAAAGTMSRGPAAD